MVQRGSRWCFQLKLGRRRRAGNLSTRFLFDLESKPAFAIDDEVRVRRRVVKVAGNSNAKRGGQRPIRVPRNIDALNELCRRCPCLGGYQAQPEPELGLEPERRLAAVNADPAVFNPLHA
jgi:hypothetical protein